MPVLYSANCKSFENQQKVFIIAVDEDSFLAAKPQDDVFVHYEDGCDEKVTSVSKGDLYNITRETNL
jgi:hypothetical protein